MLMHQPLSLGVDGESKEIVPKYGKVRFYLLNTSGREKEVDKIFDDEVQF